MTYAYEHEANVKIDSITENLNKLKSIIFFFFQYKEIEELKLYIEELGWEKRGFVLEINDIMKDPESEKNKLEARVIKLEDMSEH